MDTCGNAIIYGEILFQSYFRFLGIGNYLIYWINWTKKLPFPNMFLDIKKRIKENKKWALTAVYCDVGLSASSPWSYQFRGGGHIKDKLNVQIN